MLLLLSFSNISRFLGVITEKITVNNFANFVKNIFHFIFTRQNKKIRKEKKKNINTVTALIAWDFGNVSRVAMEMSREEIRWEAKVIKSKKREKYIEKCHPLSSTL